MAMSVESFFKRMPYNRVKVMAGDRIKDARKCSGCRECVSKCPYSLDIPELLKDKIVKWGVYEAENEKIAGES
jgi:predicted aldo/keto reductase-like oxidoreductase